MTGTLFSEIVNRLTSDLVGSLFLWQEAIHMVLQVKDVSLDQQEFTWIPTHIKIEAISLDMLETRTLWTTWGTLAEKFILTTKEKKVRV